MKRILVVLGGTFVVACVTSFVIIRRCEHSHRCDSIGMWYTFYGAAWWAVEVTVGAAIVIGAFAVVAYLRKHSSTRR
jgi:hypothetical protein